MRPVPRQPAHQRGRRPGQRTSVQGHPSLHAHLHGLPRLTCQRGIHRSDQGGPGYVHWTQGGMPCFKCHTGDAWHGMTAETGAPMRKPNATMANRCLPAQTVILTLFGQERDPAAQCPRREAGLPGMPQRGKQELLRLPRADQRRRNAVLQDRAGGDGLQDRPEPETERRVAWNYVALRQCGRLTRTTSLSTARTCWRTSTVPTWKYATPHNIQRNTPQNKSCDSCHGNAALFINENDLRPYEVEANKGVIPTTLPPKMGQ